MQLSRVPAEYRAGAKAVLPLVAVIGSVGVVFGYLAAASGLSPVAAVVMSGTTFAGSAQFAAVSILANQGTTWTAVSAGALLNVRYVPLTIAVAPALRGPLWKRLALAQLVVDESCAVAYLGAGRFSVARLVGAGLVLYVTHVAATGLGAVIATLPADPSALGLDSAFPALFVILLWPHIRHRRPLAAALVGATIALVLTPFAPPGVPIVAAACSGVLGAKVR
jgi:4-azaleucine resistance transporter AzlC